MHHASSARQAEHFGRRNAMTFPRRQFMLFAGVSAVTFVASPPAWAQTYPTRPVRIIVGAPAGGSYDIIARLIGQGLAERLGQQFIIENRSGANTNIGTESVVRAAPDGYTLLLAADVNAVNATLYEKLNFNFLRDISSVGSIARLPNVMTVHR